MTTMDETLLVGYLLGALEPEENREVERYVAEQPEANRRLELLRRSLQPLEADRGRIDPPPDLWTRTMAFVEREAPPAPRSIIPFPRSTVPPRAWWRRSNVIVAASLFLFVALLIPPGISYVRYRHNITACQDNMRVFYTALKNFADRNHPQGEIPNVAMLANSPRNVAGLVVPVLYQDGLLRNDFSAHCPSNGVKNLEASSLPNLMALNKEDFDKQSRELLGCYAYSLGYRDENGNHRNYRCDPSETNSEFIPILADRPPLHISSGDLGNSPNHLGKGQNVLYSDGHGSFRTTRGVGVNGDDIYLNEDNVVGAGKHRWDAVLGESTSRP